MLAGGLGVLLPARPMERWNGCREGVPGGGTERELAASTGGVQIRTRGDKLRLAVECDYVFHWERRRDIFNVTYCGLDGHGLAMVHR